MKAVCALLKSKCCFYEGNLQNGVNNLFISPSQGQMQQKGVIHSHSIIGKIYLRLGGLFDNCCCTHSYFVLTRGVQHLDLMLCSKHVASHLKWKKKMRLSVLRKLN